MEKIYHHITPLYYSPQELEQYLKAQSILDIIMSPEEDDWLRLVQKYASETPAYNISDGSGNEMDIFFEDNGVFLKGFDHENELNPFAADDWDDTFFEKIYEGIPHNFLEIYEDEESLQTMTFCMWYNNQTKQWNQTIVEDNDGGKDFLLGYIFPSAAKWSEWAKYYYEIDIEVSIVEKVYQRQVLTVEDIRKLNPERDTEAALREIAQLMD